MIPRRVLLVAYAFPPNQNAQAIRWLMLVRQLVARGVEVEVLTRSMPEYFRDLLDEIPPAVTVHRTWPGPIEGLALRGKAALRSEDDWIGARQKGAGAGLARRLYLGTRRVANATLVTDLCTEWVPFAIPRATAIARRRPFDGMISSFEPGASHLVAWAVKRRVGMPWLADFGDPWISQNTPDPRRPVDRTIEERLLAAIDGATVTTSRLARVLEERHPRIRPVRIVPQGFDPELVARVGPERPTAPAHLHVVYTGTLYERMRDPTRVFAGVRLARERGVPVVLTIAGRIPAPFVEAALRPEDDAIRVVGLVPYKRSLALQKGADVLLHLDNLGTDVQTPGKLYEYLAAGRPILVVRNGPPESSEAAQCVRAGACGRDVENTPEAIADALAAFAEARQAGPLEGADRDFVAAHSFERSADALYQALTEAMQRAYRPR